MNTNRVDKDLSKYFSQEFKTQFKQKKKETNKNDQKKNNLLKGNKQMDKFRYVGAK